MEDVKWLEVAVNTTPERLDEVTAKLTAAGMASVVIEDEFWSRTASTGTMWTRSCWTGWPGSAG